MECIIFAGALWLTSLGLYDGQDPWMLRIDQFALMVQRHHPDRPFATQNSVYFASSADDHIITIAGATIKSVQEAINDCPELPAQQQD